VGEKVGVDEVEASVGCLLMEGRWTFREGGGGRLAEETMAMLCFEGGGTLSMEGMLALSAWSVTRVTGRVLFGPDFDDVEVG
jgi:hypothetical protein